MKSSTLNKCSSCKAYIVWVLTKNGKSMPINYTEGPENHSMFPITPPLVFDSKTMVSHFATCPEASKFRKRDSNTKQSQNSKREL
jgi:hypothetical protein